MLRAALHRSIQSASVIRRVLLETRVTSNTRAISRRPEGLATAVGDFACLGLSRFRHQNEERVRTPKLSATSGRSPDRPSKRSSLCVRRQRPRRGNVEQGGPTSHFGRSGAVGHPGSSNILEDSMRQVTFAIVIIGALAFAGAPAAFAQSAQPAAAKAAVPKAPAKPRVPSAARVRATPRIKR